MYSEIIYMQNSNSCVRNQDILNIGTSSDLSVFTPPILDISGATKIQNLTNTSEGVYLITGGTEIDLTLEFTGGTLPYSSSSVTNIIEIYKYNETNYFTTPYIYETDEISFSGDVNNSAYTINVPLDIVSPDGEYLLKPYFKFTPNTEFLSLFNITYNNRKETGDLYNLYNDNFDYYISVSTPAETPQLTLTSGNTTVNFGNIVSYSIIPSINGQTEFTIQNYIDDVIVNLNGLTLANNLEYSISGQTLTMLNPTSTDDIITIVHSSVGENAERGLTNDYINIEEIISGTTGNQGNNKIYYNIDTDKYEVYTNSRIRIDSDIIITLNGVSLANGIDFYKSITNNKRIILTGDLIIGDNINIFYYSETDIVGNILSNTPTVGWAIDIVPTKENGQFTIEVTKDTSFSSLTFSSIIEYNINQRKYAGAMVITGSAGDQYYYRIKNEKFYQPITGNTIDTVAYSEIVPVVLQINSINSY